MRNVKQGSCEYQLLKSIGLTRPENRTLVCRLRGERSNHKTASRLLAKIGAVLPLPCVLSSVH